MLTAISLPPSLLLAGIKDPKALVARALAKGQIHRAVTCSTVRPPKNKNALAAPGYTGRGPVPFDIAHQAE